MVKILSSSQKLPDGEELVRWHLVDDFYQIIKPVERFLRFKKLSGASVGTLKVYTEKLKAFWKYLKLIKLDWQDFTVQNMAEFGYWYLTGVLFPKGRDIPSDLEDPSPMRNQKTVNLALTVLAQFYEFHTCNGTVEDKNLREYRIPYSNRRSGLLAGYFKQAPIGTKRVKYKESHRFPGCLTPEQIRTLIDACRTARDKLILWLLADTGMRKGELLGLHMTDLDWGARTLKIVRRENPNHAYAKGQEREISIAELMKDPEFCEIVTEYLDEEYPHHMTEQIGHDMLFVVLHRGSKSFGQPLEPQNLNKLLKRLQLKTKINVERLYPHLFRHTFATHNILEAGQKRKDKLQIAKTVQRQLGHRSIFTTLDVYDHSFNEAEFAEEMKRITESK